MGKDVLQKVIDVDSQSLDQKISLSHLNKSFELSVKGEQAVGHVFDHFPLAQLQASPEPHFKVRWVDSRQFNFSWQDWQEEVSEAYSVEGRHLVLERDYVAIFEGDDILLIASYELGIGFLNFLDHLAKK